MARMLVIYKTPGNRQAFLDHYFNVHVPMAKELPGLVKFETSVGPVIPLAGAKDPFFIATLHFASLEAIKIAFASELGRSLAKDRRHFAPNDEDVQMFLFDDQVA